MDDATLADLKQFITAAVAQAVADLPTKDDMDAQFAAVDQRFAGMGQRFNRLEHRIDELEVSMNTQFSVVAVEFTDLRGEMNTRFDDLDAKVDTIADAHSEALADHDRRLAKLEA